MKEWINRNKLPKTLWDDYKGLRLVVVADENGGVYFNRKDLKEQFPDLKLPKALKAPKAPKGGKNVDG